MSEFDYCVPWVITVRPPKWKQDAEMLVWGTEDKKDVTNYAHRRWGQTVRRVELLLDICSRYVK